MKQKIDLKKQCINMSAFCDRCELILNCQISQVSYQLTCSSCDLQKMPESAVIFSSEDEDKFAPNVTKVYGDITTQRWYDQCPTCKENYYIYYQGGNKDVLYICKCSAEQQQPADVQGGARNSDNYSANDIIEQFQSQFEQTQQNMAYDFMPILQQ